MVREATLKALVEVVAKVILNVFVFVFLSDGLLLQETREVTIQ